MVEVIKHFFGFCGEHWHPNIWTFAASAPIVGPAIYYIKCKCGGMFTHKKDCKNK
tara:strand:+ start:388 stop:552 length:165 start_codon:yes stop_codon:yes gene_type:complete